MTRRGTFRRIVLQVAAIGAAAVLSACAGVAAAAPTLPVAGDWLIGTWEAGAVATNQGTVVVTVDGATGTLVGKVAAPFGGFCRPLEVGATIWSGIRYDAVTHLYTGTATYPRSSLGCQIGSVQATWQVRGGGVYDFGSRQAKFGLSWSTPSTGSGPPASGNTSTTEFERPMTPAELAAPWHKGRWTGVLRSSGKVVGQIEFGIGDVSGPRDIAWLRATLPLVCAAYGKDGRLGPDRPAQRTTVAVGRTSGFKGGTISIHAQPDEPNFGLFTANGSATGTAAALRGAAGSAGRARIAATVTFWGWLNGYATGDLSGVSTLAHAFGWAEAPAAGARPVAGQTLCKTPKLLDWTVAWDRSGAPYTPVR